MEEKNYTSPYQFMKGPYEHSEDALLEALDHLAWQWSRHRKEKLFSSTLYYQNLGHFLGRLVRNPTKKETEAIALLTILEAAFQEIGATQCAEITNRWRRAKNYAFHYPQEDREGLFVDEGVEL